MTNNYTLGREIPMPEGHGKKWIVGCGCVGYETSLTIAAPYDDDAQELAQAAVDGWNEWYRRKHNLQ